MRDFQELKKEFYYLPFVALYLFACYLIPATIYWADQGEFDFTRLPAYFSCGFFLGVWIVSLAIILGWTTFFYRFLFLRAFLSCIILVIGVQLLLKGEILDSFPRSHHELVRRIGLALPGLWVIGFWFISRTALSRMWVLTSPTAQFKVDRFSLSAMFSLIYLISLSFPLMVYAFVHRETLPKKRSLSDSSELDVLMFFFVSTCYYWLLMLCAFSLWAKFAARKKRRLAIFSSISAASTLLFSGLAFLFEILDPTPQLAYLNVAASVGIAIGLVACLCYLTFVEKTTGRWLRFVPKEPSTGDDLSNLENIEPITHVEVIDNFESVE